MRIKKCDKHNPIFKAGCVGEGAEKIRCSIIKFISVQMLTEIKGASGTNFTRWILTLSQRLCFINFLLY